jgi:hypothetical protein
VSERAKAIDEAKLGVLWIDALNRALGPAEALRFLALFHRETTDYVEVSKSFTKIKVWKKSSSKARYQRTSHTPARSWVRQQLYAEGKFREITGPWWSPACYLGASWRTSRQKQSCRATMSMIMRASWRCSKGTSKKLGCRSARREPAEALLAEFKGSLWKLLPLRERIRQTDELIDATGNKPHNLYVSSFLLAQGYENI